MTREEIKVFCEKNIMDAGAVFAKLGITKQALHSYVVRGYIQPIFTLGNTSVFWKKDVDDLAKKRSENVDIYINSRKNKEIYKKVEKVLD